MTEIATRTDGALALRADQEFWTERQTAALAQLGVADASNADLAVFLHVSQRSGLDPFARQIYMIGRPEKRRVPGGGEQWVTRQTIQTGIDGYRLIARRAADRAGERLSQSLPAWCDRAGRWHEGVWPDPDTPPVAAKVVVYRDGEPFPGVAMFREYAQTKSNGDLTAMWRRMPANQLAKCAEAQALRKAYPQELSGIYVDDEMPPPAPRPRAHRVEPGSSAPVTVDELTIPDDVVDPAPPPPVGSQRPATRDQITKIILMLRDLDVEDDDAQREWLTRELQRPVESRTSLTRAEATTVIDVLTVLLDERGEQPGGDS